MTLSDCPSCGATFAKPPRAKTRCRTCGQYAYVRSVQTLLPRPLVTQSEASAIDQLGRVDPMMQGAISDAVRARVARGESLSEAVVAELSALGHWYLVAIHRATCGEDPAPALRRHHDRLLRDAVTMHGERTVVVVRPAPTACAPCRTDNLKEWTAAQALVEQPLPHRGCTRPLRRGEPAFCRCVYAWAGPHRTSPAELIRELELVCFGGPRDGERLVLRNLRAIHSEGELAGYLADDQPIATDEGAYVITAELQLVWTLRT